MPGIPASFTYASADIVEWYDEHPGCVVLIWLPAGWASQHRTSVVVGTYGGGWISSDHWLNVGTKRSELVSGLNVGLAQLFLASGWAYAHVLWPMGWMAKNLQYYPAMRHPRIQRSMARSIQWIKTRAAAIRDRDNITGDADHSLAIDESQFVVVGVSSGTDNWGYSIYQPDGAIPYDSEEGPAHRADFWQVRFNHRAAAAILFDPFTDLRWIDQALQSANLISLFGAPDRFQESPKLPEVPLEVLRDASMLPQIERDDLWNRDIALCSFSPGSYGTGNIMNTPGRTAEEWRALAAPRLPITGVGDVHEVGTAISLEDTLKLIEERKGVPWSQTKHRIFWGNPTNNPDGLPAFGGSYPGGFGTPEAFAHDWVVNTLQIPAHL